MNERERRRGEKKKNKKKRANGRKMTGRASQLRKVPIRRVQEAGGQDGRAAGIKGRRQKQLKRRMHVRASSMTREREKQIRGWKGRAVHDEFVYHIFFFFKKDLGNRNCCRADFLFLLETGHLTIRFSRSFFSSSGLVCSLCDVER